MKIIHRIEINEEYLRIAQRLILSQQLFIRLLYVNPWFPWIPTVIFSGALITMMLLHMTDATFVAFVVGMLALSLLSQFYKPRMLAKARNRNPLKGSAAIQSLDENGLDSASSLGHSHLHWSAFPIAVLYPDGVLLRLATRSYIWLPDASLTEGSPQDVRQLVREHVKEIRTPMLAPPLLPR